LEGRRAGVVDAVASAERALSLLAGGALGCAVLTAISTALIGRVLPWLGIAIARGSLAWTITEGLVGFAVLGLLLLLSIPMSAYP
jgi:hypothetical protein